MEIEKFKNRVKTINYEFGENKDNYNDKKYNDYEHIKNLDDLIELSKFKHNACYPYKTLLNKLYKVKKKILLFFMIV